MNQLMVRSISGAIFVLLMVLAIFSSVYTAGLMFVLLTAGALHEYYRLYALKSALWPLLGGIVLFSLGALVIYGELPLRFAWIALIFPVIILATDLSRKRKSPAANTIITSWIYIIPAFLMGLYMVADSADEGAKIMLSFFILLWSNDSGAYLWGKLLGKHKLYPAVSPGKTWEGCVGGGITAIIAAIIISQYFIETYTLTDWIVAAVLTAIFATLGDLYESLLKRSAGVKDSGKIMPGHGGVLDRFDGYLFALPVVFVYFYALSPLF
jgi:phosphatidate cytidylyltransferase